MKWKTAEVKKLVEDTVRALPDKPKRILVCEPGGDYDSEGLQVQYGKGDEFLNVCGFHTEHTNLKNGNTPEDMEIEMVEVSDGQDSRGGLNSSDNRVYGLRGNLRSFEAQGVCCGAALEGLFLKTV